jgi:hypothetical protein
VLHATARVQVVFQSGFCCGGWDRYVGVLIVMWQTLPGQHFGIVVSGYCEDFVFALSRKASIGMRTVDTQSCCYVCDTNLSQICWHSTAGRCCSAAVCTTGLGV